jgi:hypothetical protein
LAALPDIPGWLKALAWPGDAVEPAGQLDSKHRRVAPCDGDLADAGPHITTPCSRGDRPFG